MDLDIHLDRSDTLVGTCHLEVHIAEEVLKPLDVCKEYEILVLVTCHKTAADTGHLGLDRHACSHKSHAGSAC